MFRLFYFYKIDKLNGKFSLADFGLWFSVTYTYS
jgi:hypothetical protein